MIQDEGMHGIYRGHEVYWSVACDEWKYADTNESVEDNPRPPKYQVDHGGKGLKQIKLENGRILIKNCDKCPFMSGSTGDWYCTLSQSAIHGSEKILDDCKLEDVA